MKVWTVRFIEDAGEAPIIFSTRDKAWNYLEWYFKRIFGDSYKDVEDYKELKGSYDECCQYNSNYFMNCYIVVDKVGIDEKGGENEDHC